MNEPKKRGRPSKAEIAAREAQPKEEPMQTPVLLKSTEERDRAQAYALKVWAGQSESLGRGERVRRIKAALEGQGLSFDGVRLPGDAVDEEEWTEEDEKPVTWKRNGA